MAVHLEASEAGVDAVLEDKSPLGDEDSTEVGSREVASDPSSPVEIKLPDCALGDRLKLVGEVAVYEGR